MRRIKLVKTSQQVFADLLAAKSAYHTARIAAALHPSPDSLLVLHLAAPRLARARRAYAPFARAARAAAQERAAHDLRYQSQIRRRSRTLGTGAALRRERAAKAHAARRAAVGKRARNLVTARQNHASEK